MKNTIVTSADYPPIPTDKYDWSAHFDWDDGGETIIGHGATEADAVLSLLVMAGEVDDDGSFVEEIINLAFEGWKLK